MILLYAQADPVSLDVATLVTDGSTFGLVMVALYGAFRLYKTVKSDERETRQDTDKRLDRLRRNVLTLTTYAGDLSRLVPPEVERPAFPELESELKSSEE